MLALPIVYIVPTVASKRKVSARKNLTLRAVQPPQPEKQSPTSIAAVALGVGIAGASMLVDPQAEAAFDAPKRLIGLIGIVVASIAMITIADFPSPRQLPQRSRMQSAVAILVGFAIFGAIIAALASPRRAISLDATRALILFALCLPLGASRALEGKRGVKILAVFIVASTINAVISIVQTLGVFQPLSIERIAGRVTSVGLIGNEGYLGLLMALGAAASLSTARFASSPRIRKACWAASGTMLIALAATSNITGWIALAIGVVPLGWNLVMTRQFSSRPAAIAIAVLLVAIIATPGARARVISLVRQGRTRDWDSLLSYRLGAWAAAIDMMGERPILGFGPGTFGAEFVPHRLNAELRWGRRLVNPESSSFYAQAHCDYLQGFAEMGIPAGLAADAALATLIFGLVQAARRRPVRISHEALLLLAMLLVGAVGALAWPTLQQPTLAIPLLLAAGRGWRLLGGDARADMQ